MKLLKEFFLCEGLNLDGPTISREGVRSIVFQGDQVLMVYSPENKGYKFPGGGIQERENHEETLLREIKEECGMVLSEVEDVFGYVVEYNKPKEEEYDVYKQIPYYYLCRVNPSYVGQNLDEYERKLGFRPEWVSIDVAIAKNRSVLNGDFGDPPRWTKRDTYVLARLAETLISKGCTYG